MSCPWPSAAPRIYPIDEARLPRLQRGADEGLGFAPRTDRQVRPPGAACAPKAPASRAATCRHHQPAVVHRPSRAVAPRRSGNDHQSRSRLRMRPVSEQEPAHHIHLPQLHRHPASTDATPPAAAARPGRSARPHQRSVTPAPTVRHHSGLAQLERNRRAPHDRCTRRSSAPRLHLRRHLMRTIHRPVRPVRQPLQPAPLIPRRHPSTDCRTPRTGRHLRHRAALANHRQDRLIVLSHTSSLMPRECQGSAKQPSNRRNLRDQPKDRCQPSAEVTHSSGAGGTRTHDRRIMSPLL